MDNVGGIKEMGEEDRVAFHFLNPELYNKFIKELSADQFVKLLKNDQELLKNIFADCKITSRSFSLPEVQLRINKKSKTSPTIRNFLCEAWLQAKSTLISNLFNFLPYSFKGSVNDMAWVNELHELQKKKGYEAVAKNVVKALIWTGTDPNDIRIVISILSAGYEDQETLELFANKAIVDCEKNPSFFIEDLEKKIVREENAINKYNEDRQKLEKVLIKCKSKLKESNALREKDHNNFEEKLSDLKRQEDDTRIIINGLKAELSKAENGLENIFTAQKQLKQEDKSLQKKVEYEQNKIDKKILLTEKALKEIESKIATNKTLIKNMLSIKTSIKNMLSIREKIEKEILSQKQKLKPKPVSKKVDEKETAIESRKRRKTLMEEVKGAPTVETLIQLLKNKDADVQKQAAGALGKTGDPRAVEPLIKLIKLKKPNGQTEEELDLDLSFEDLELELEPEDQEEEQDAIVRIIAAGALGKIGGPRAVEALIQLLKDRNADIRRQAAGALGKIGDPRALEPLIQLLEDKIDDVCKQAGDALGKIGAPRTVGLLIKFIKLKKYNEQIEEELDLDMDVEDLDLELETENQEEELDKLVQLASKSIVKIGTPAIELLMQALESEDWETKKIAKAIVKEIKSRQTASG